MVNTITTTTSTWTDTDIDLSAMYTYQVFAYKGDYLSAGSEEVSGQVIDIADCDITLSETNFTYNGKSQKPSVTVSYEGTSMSSIYDYSYTYSDDTINVGTVSITFTGKGSYGGSVTLYYTITDASTNDYLLGDVNVDGEIDYLDAMTVLRYDAELITLDEAQLLAGDVNGDGAVDSLDAILILRYDADLIDSF